MKFQEIGNRKMSIAAKTAIACGVVTLSLLIINATVFQRLESNLVSLIFEGYVNEVDGTIDKQGASQKRDLNTNVSIHAEVLGNAAASFLYDLDKNSLRRMLTAYIRLPELKAVEVLDETGEPYFAIWKDPEIQDMRQIPEDVVIDKSITGTADAIFKEEKVGSVNVYFTDVYLKKQMDVAKQEAKAAINDFRDLVNVKFGNAIWVQRGTILCVVIILIAAIILTMSIIAIRPLKKLTLMVVDLVDGEGDLTKRLELKSHDEIGSLASWFNRFIEQTHGLVREIVSNAKTLNDSSEDMSQIADSLSSGASGGGSNTV